MSGRRGKGSGSNRRRVTENASASRIAEADEVWHSTAINESGVFGENVPPSREKQAKGLSRGKGGTKRSVPTLQEDNARDSGRGGSTTGDYDDYERYPPSPSPVVLNPPSGHSFFSSVLQKCGYVLRQPQGHNEMFYDVMKFRMTLSDWLKDNNDPRKRIETDTSKFMKALNSYLSEKQTFVLALTQTRSSDEVIQPSILSCLMGVEALQDEILKVAIPFIAEASLSNREEDVSLVNSTLNQLKGHHISVDARKLSDKLLSLVDAAVTDSKILIIKAIPDILPTHIHPYAGEKLLAQFADDGSQKNVALMDCFSSMDIPGQDWSSIRYVAIDQMATAPLRDIPAYISFLFLTAAAKDSLSEVITLMREKVTLNPDAKHSRNDAFQSEILEKLGFCSTLNPIIATTWIKLIRDDLLNGLTENVAKIDFIMLCVFSELHNKPVIGALKLLFEDKSHSLKLFDEMMENNRVMVFQLFASILKILETFLRTKPSKVTGTVSEIVCKLFVGMTRIEAQDVIGSLTGILVHYHPARDTILQIFSKIAETHPKKLLFFSPYLMEILDHIMEYRANQIKELMNVLAILSQTDSGETNNDFNNEFSILLRKQLIHSDLKIRCYGIIGALATVRQIAKKEVPNYERMDELLKTAWSLVQRDDDACGIFLDEMSVCAKSLPRNVCCHFRNILKEKFEALWTVDAGNTELIQLYSKKCSLKMVSAFDANLECSEQQIIIIFESKPLEMKPTIIPAHLQALSILEGRVEEGSLEGIDMILGSPILFPSLEEYYQRESIVDISYQQRFKLGEYLVLAINFFRESVSAFVKNENKELRIKLWLRLGNIFQLQKILVKHLDLFPNLPTAYASNKTLGSKDGAGPSGFKAPRPVPQKGAKKKVNTAKPKPKSAPKKAKRDNQNADDSDEDTSVAQPAARAQKTVLVNLDDVVQPKQILPYLRSFRKSVFEELLPTSLRVEESNDSINFSSVLHNLTLASQDPNVLGQVERFSPEVLFLLLTDLKYQLNDETRNLNILSIRKIFKCLCVHVNTIYGALTKMEENYSSLRNEHQKKLEDCLKLLIVLLSFYFDQVRKEKDGDKATAISRIQRTLLKAASRNNEEAPEQVVASISKYLAGLVSVIKNPVTALEHLKMLKAFHDLLDANARVEVKKVIDESARAYLRNEWKLSSAQVDGILKVWFSIADSPLDVVTSLCKKIMVPVKGDQENKVPNSTMYKACVETNFHTWYAAIFSALSQNVYKKLRKRGDFEDQITDWQIAVEMFKLLVNVTKSKSKPVILSTVLKNCRPFMEAFVSGGSELLKDFFKQDFETAQKFCKTLQIPCRQIQHICEHAKRICDTNLLKSVPLVKRTLEMFVWKMRVVITADFAAPDAFWLGNLKHRDLEGHEIGSQLFDLEEDLVDSSDDDSDSFLTDAVDNLRADVDSVMQDAGFDSD